MAFERPGLRELIARTLTDTQSRLTADELLRRADAEVFARVLAGASHTLHGHLDWIARQVIYDTADAEILERWAGLFAIDRKPAASASGTVTATGSGTIPAGTLYRRSDGAEFAVTASSTAPCAVPVQAVVAGAAGNTAAGTLSLQSPIAGVASTAAVVTISNGADVEDDASLRARLRAHLRAPPHGGAASDYVQWALEVPGVTRAWVYPLEGGAGTVTVRFVRDDDASIIPDAGEVAAVQTHIDAVRPVTAAVTVAAPTAVPLNFSIHLVPDTPETRTAVDAALRELIAAEAEPGKTILITHLREAISTAVGETDHTLTSPAVNVTYSISQIAAMGTITWT
jgi:uncharacterized phage protein gp47/JayE